jgi:hypothetical protein
MNTAMTLAMAALTITMVACAAEAPTEQTGKTEDHYDVACVSNIHEPAGSPAWSAKLQECLAGYGASGAGAGAGASGGQSCTQSTSCVNGSCTCGAGPNEGQACDGSQASGATSCSELCHFCQ